MYEQICDNRRCPAFQKVQYVTSQRCRQCDNVCYNSWWHDGDTQIDRHQRSQDRESARPREYDAYDMIVRETGDYNHGAGLYYHHEQPRSYASRDPYQNRVQSPPRRPRERSPYRGRSPSPYYQHRQRRGSSHSREEYHQRSYYDSHQGRSPPPHYRHSERRRSSHSRRRQYYESDQRRSPSSCGRHDVYSDLRGSRDYDSDSRRDRDQQYGFESQYEDRYASQRTLVVRGQDLDEDASYGYTRDQIEYNENQEIHHRQRAAHEVDEQRHWLDFQPLQDQDYHGNSYFEQQHENQLVVARSPPRSPTLSSPTGYTEQESDIHVECFNLKDIRQKRFPDSGIECSRCRAAGKQADHPRFACGTMHEIFTHYVGPRLGNKNKWCQNCRSEGRINISKHHSLEQCNSGMWCDHPNNALVKQKAGFEAWNVPYPGEVLGYEPETVSQMYRNMKHRRTVDA